jgi:gliding motility-associated-like protein
MYADSTSIVFNPLPTVSLGNDTAVCGSIVLNAGFPFAGILWNSGNTGQLETAGTSGLYYVQVTDANGCTAADSVNVTIHALPVVDIGNDTSICGATSFTLSTNQSYPSILWSNGGATQTITIFSSGIYSVSVQDSIGCTSGDSVQVLLNSIPSVDLGNDTTLCGGSLTLSTVLNYPFISWSNGDNTLTTVAASSGLYSVSIQDINGCTTSDSINVIINPVPSVFIGNDTTICGSSPVTLSTNQFFSSILWSNGATTQNNIISTGGLYYVTVSDVPGCSASDSIVIVYHPFPVVDLGNDTTLCGSYTADAGQPFPFISWSDGSTSQTDNITVTGTYYVAVADVFGCPAGDTVSVIILPAPVAGITGPVLICEGATESYSASAAGGSAPYQYAWSNADVLPATQITFTAISTTISVTVTDANGCSDNAALVVTAVPDPVAILSPGFSGCAPVHAGFLNESTNAFSYLWDFGDGTTSTLPDPSHEYAVPGSYNITLITTNSAGCSDTLVAYSFVNAFASPLAAISTSGNVSSEHPVLTVSDSSHDGDNCVLYFGDGTSMNGCGWNSTTHTYEQEGDYTLTQIVVNADGCADTATVDVNVSFENTLFAPSAFTPNGSGHNDVFFIYGTGLNDFRLTIYDRWGEKIFESNDMLKGWDGTYKGRFVEQDVYVWKADYTTRRMGKQQRIGHVTVVK